MLSFSNAIRFARKRETGSLPYLVRALLTRFQFNRYVETPAFVAVVLCDVLWIYTTVWGNTLGGFQLSVRGFIVGGTVGLVGALLFAPSHVDLISGMVGPYKRIASFCMAATFFCGVGAAAFAIAMNRFLPAEPETDHVYSVSQASKIRGGWSVTFADTNGRMHEHTFGNAFGPVPIGAQFQFRIQTGVLGYPYFHAYKRIS